ncbi:MAG: hypothetical protein IJH12_02895 [Clostridia bacterium]|nr:hypothetical protein [Clostridia bacterium]
MKKRILNLVTIFTMLISAMVMLTGCGKKVEEKIVYAKIIIETGNQVIITSKPNKELINTYEELINSNAIKAVIEKSTEPSEIYNLRKYKK